MAHEDNLKKLNIKLPDAPTPVGAYVAYKIINNFVYISGQVSFEANGELIKGKIGLDLTLEQGQAAAKVCAINILSQIKAACNGDLNNVKSCIKLTGFVNSIDSFVDQPKIINPASELMTQVFGENGKHARAAVSVNSLPLGAAVEIEAIFEIN
jgi:enamine deaminase RidA (YjgF/YER057c/UK114 family)|tara:strand:+ start:754 stop:1215 length:462 start_codon:yes stop_codon:yes gene_type:complete